MKNLSFAVGTVYTSLLVGILISIDQLICKFMPIPDNAGFIYVAFVAWSVYFLAGATVKEGLKAGAGYVAGIIFAILIFKLLPVFEFSGFYQVPLAAFVVVLFWLYLEKLPSLVLLPASFLAAGVFFGMMTYIDGATLTSTTIVELLYSGLGLFWGWVTIAGKELILKPFNKK